MELIRQLEAWNEASEFSRAIAAIEAIPEPERGFQLTLWLGRLYANLAVLGDHDQRVYTDSRGRTRQQEQDAKRMQKALKILYSIREEGENDPTWNSRMAYCLWTMEDRHREAAQYSRRWLELAPDDPDARQLAAEVRAHLARLKREGKNPTKWKEGND